MLTRNKLNCDQYQTSLLASQILFYQSRKCQTKLLLLDPQQGDWEFLLLRQNLKINLLLEAGQDQEQSLNLRHQDHGPTPNPDKEAESEVETPALAPNNLGVPDPSSAALITEVRWRTVTSEY